jgi:PrtD family type I secretion system ABC transporter
MAGGGAGLSRPESGGAPLVTKTVKGLRRVLIDAAAFSFFVNLLMLTGPLYMMQVYDRVLASRSVETLIVVTGLTIVLFGAMATLDFARGALLARTAGDFEKGLKETVFDAAIDAGKSTGATEQPLRDLRTLRQFVASPALTAVFDAPWAPFFLAVIFAMHWVLGLVSLAGLLVLLALSLFNERASRAENESALKIAGEADRLAGAALRNAAALGAMGMRGDLKKRWVSLSDAAGEDATRASDVIGGYSAASKAFRLFMQSAILGAGAYLAIGNAISPGAMIAASIIAGRALAPIESVTAQWKNFAQAHGAWRRFNSFLAGAGPAVEKTPLPAPKGAISVERLVCQPAGARTPVVKGVSFALSPGEALGLIGPSGAGKSTLARAIVGVERRISGEVRIDGAEIAQWDADALGRHLGYLPQEVELFAGTAAQNIARFRENADPEMIVEAAKAAGAHEMILSFPDGYDTEIGDRGRHLSSGQRQRLGLARALFGNPVIIVLDEPNANLDQDGDAALAAAIQRLKERRATVVVIAHRPSAIAFVDKILVIANGEQRAFGPRDEVLGQIAPKAVTPFKRAGGEAVPHG